MANFASITVLFTDGIAPIGHYVIHFGLTNTYLTGGSGNSPTSFAASTNALNSANSYRSKFLQNWGPGGALKQLECTVSQPWATQVPNVYALRITMQTYLNGDIALGMNAGNLGFQIIQEVKPAGLTAFVSNISTADSSVCDLAKYTLTPSGGVAPYTVRYAQTQQVIATGLSFDFSRNSPNRKLQLVDSGGLTFDFEPPYVRSYSISQIQQDPQLAGTNIRIITSNNGIGESLALDYSIDGVNWQAGNSFPLVAPGNLTAYVRDPYGCVKTQSVTVTAFQYQKIVAVHNMLNFEFKEPEATAPEYMDVRLFVNDVPVGD